MKVIELISLNLKGKKIKHRNSHGRDVVLEVESAEVQPHFRQITPDTPQNDFWGESCSWETIKVTFVDGSSIDVSLSSELQIVD